MKEHHATEDDACTAVEDYLRAWEFDAALRHDPGAFKLRFVRSEIEDRNPAPGTVHALASPITATAELGVARGTVLPPSYPAPPSTGLRSDPDVERMFNRYAKYRDRREPLTSMTYFCLNVLEESTGDRPKAAKRYGISKCVLDQLGNLSSIRGGSDARKAAGVHHDLTGQGKPVPGSSRQGDHPKGGRVCIRPERISPAHNHARPSSPAVAFLQSVAGTPDSRSSCLTVLPFVRGTHFGP